ncbi:transmembrane protein 186 [Microplitis demolitor]|uniref:transmembrane protein 186 n=1 Tax=Microplitis demolitor TaxID=69319 RepID=UPI0004CD5F3C|nr:transmembrane protein 186 [Microplitis demolitor]
MSLLTANCARLNLYRHLLRTSVSSQLAARTSTSKPTLYESKRFPGYQVLYNFENIKNVSLVNRLKYRMSILSCIVIPSSMLLEVTNLMPLSMSEAFTFLTVAVTIFFHGIGLFCNNVIGYIYSKPKSNDLKISYVNYWGKRIDINANAKTITCTESSNMFFRPLFNSVKTETTKFPLKLYVKGKVMDEKHFDNIFGIPF